MTVAVGQTVRGGEVLGLCGNSGRSPEPHLHFQLQSRAELGSPTVPCHFSDCVLLASRPDEPDRLLSAHEPKVDQVLDFAFDVHTQLGERCIGGKVNNKLV